MILISPDYRATTSWMGPAAEADVLQIIQATKTQHNVEHIILCGGSMGGTGALTFAARHPKLIDGVVAFNGTANLVEYERFQDAIAESFGGTKLQVPKQYHDRSAEFFSKRFSMPLAATTGGKDDIVPPHSVLRLINSVKKLHSHVLTILQRWLNQPQEWIRDTDGPVVSLGNSEEFDDTHIFAPTVARHQERYYLWYCGSKGTVAERVFHLGLATSSDGISFQKHHDNPVFGFGDGRHSILTPCVLPDGGKLRMWFSSTWFEGASGRHTLHESFSENGVKWTDPSAALLENVYSPTVIRTDRNYQMWFVDVKTEPWIIRHASSSDGIRWVVTEEPCLVIDQPWEKSRLFYPFVKQIDGVYVMWYGSYWTGRPSTTALGFAASVDGLKWYKHAECPVFRPDPDRPWESHYVTSHSIMQLPDGTFRMWYASRRKPPFVNKYFAINTAVWSTSGSTDN
jgi:dienelactone hydrolase